MSFETDKESNVAVEIKQSNKTQTITKNLPPPPSTIQTPNFDLIKTKKTSESDAKQKHYKKTKFRLKLATIVLVIFSAVCVGWVTSNFVQINSINNSINNTKYQIDEIQLIIKESQLDGFKDIQNGDETLITSVIELEPEPLVEPTTIAKQTNWFDGFCNWIQKLFS